MSFAALGLFQTTGVPRQIMSPRVAPKAPERILIRVDLPAPLAPSKPCTLPCSIARSTPRRATVPLGNSFTTPRNCMIVFSCCISSNPHELVIECKPASPLLGTGVDRLLCYLRCVIGNEPALWRVGFGDRFVHGLEHQRAEQFG